MNSFVVVALVACVAAVQAGWHGPSGIVLQGPSSKTSLVGPEGSHISAYAPGGQIVHDEHPGYIAHAAPVHSYVAPVHTYAAPVHTYAAPVHAYAAPVHHAPATVVAHSSAYEHDGVVVAGPSGTISTGYAHHAPIVAPVVAHGYSAHGYEGEYVPDHSEALYDDGSYKPHLYHH